MSKKRLLHGMKRPLALFLALAMALAFVPVVPATALAANEAMIVSASNLTGGIATQDLSGYTFVNGQWADDTGDSDAENNTNTLAEWNTIKTGATASFTVNYSADSGSTSAATLAFKVAAPNGSNAKLLIYDNPGSGSYVGGIWNVLNNKDFPDNTANENLITALDTDYAGYWGPVLGKNLSSGFTGYTGVDDYTYYFFADQVGTYTITADLLDISSSAASPQSPLASKTVTIEVLPVEIALESSKSTTTVVSLDAFTGDLSDIDGIKTTPKETTSDGEELYSISGNVIRDVRDIPGVVVISYELDDEFSANAYENTRINVTLTGTKEDAYLLATNCANGSASDDCDGNDSCATYELIKTGFMGVWDGQDASDFNTVSSLTFFATAVGTYVIDLELADLDNGAALATGSFTIDVTAAPVLNKTVSIGGISAAITAGTASTVTYPVTTNDIDDGTIGAIKWYEGAATTTSLSSAPTGLTATLSSLYSDKATLEVFATTAVVADTYYFTVTYDGVESEVITLTVEAAPVLNKTVSIGDISAAITAGTASSSTYTVTTHDIDDGTVGAIKWYESAATTTGLPSAPTGLTATLSSLDNSEATLEVIATTAVVAGTYYFTVTYDGVESVVITLTVEAASSTSANVATAVELKAAIDTKKTTINVTTSFSTTENVTIPVGTTLNIATDTSLTVADAGTLTVYGTLALAERAQVTIKGTLVLSAEALNNLSAGLDAKFDFQGGTLKLVSNPESTLRLAGLFADADFDLGLYAGAVLNLSGYANTSFDVLLLISSGSGMIDIGNGVCGVVDSDAKLASGLTLDVQNGAALQVESDKTLIADGDIVISGTAKADISGGLTVNGDLTVSGSLTVASDADLTVNGTLEVSGKVTAESGATVSLQSNITIAADGSLDLSNVRPTDLTIGNGSNGITIILAPGAELSVPASGTYDDLTVTDEHGTELISDNGKYTIPEYVLTITPATGVGLGVSYKINVSAGSDSNNLYLIVKSTDKGYAVSLAMIAVGEYTAAGTGSGYETYVSYSTTDQVDAWLVDGASFSGDVPDWTAVETDAYLADDTYPVAP